MKIHYLSSFCLATRLSGNPAIVIEDFKGDDSAKQLLATQYNVPVTVFIEDNYLLRFFYPEREMSMCIHGALAAGAVIFKSQNINQCVAKNHEAKPIKLSKRLDFYQVEVGECEIADQKTPFDELSNMLKISEDDLDASLSYLIASIGSPKLLVPLKSLEQLNSLEPDFACIKKWSLANQVNGLYVYTRGDTAFDYYARAFNPKGGHNEDAATGVAVGALIGALNEKEIKVGQGSGLGRPSLIMAANDNGLISISGKVLFDE